MKAFLQGLRELGYEEGKNFAIECLGAGLKLDRLSKLAAELVRLKVDVIVTRSGIATRSAQQATSTVPIVMTVTGDPVKSGLAASLAQPRGNITGLTSLTPDLSGKRLELLKEIIPGVSRVAVLSSPPNLARSLDFQATQTVAHTLGMQLQLLGVDIQNDFESAFKAATRERAGALITLSHPFISRHMTKIVSLAGKSQLLAMYHRREFVEAGGLVSYGPNYSDLYRRAAAFVDKILKDAKPANLPIEQPTKFELVINLKTAKALGLKIPAHILMEADKVIE
jgi:putative ABC transport system substrate-binding protein